MSLDLLERLKRSYQNLTRSQRQVADYIAKDPHKVAFTSALAIADAANVSEATVTRLAYSLGYSGYAEMQAAVRAQANERLETLGLTRRRALSDDFSGDADVLGALARRHQESLAAVHGSVDRESFRAAAAAIASADAVLVAGHHWSRSLGSMLVDLLRSVIFHAQAFGGQEEREWQLACLSERSCVIGIGFPRYAAETVALLRAARSRGARVIAITDTVTSPLAQAADHVLTVPGTSAHPGFDFLASSVTVLYALHVAVSLVKTGGEEKQIQSLQEAYKELGTFLTGQSDS